MTFTAKTEEDIAALENPEGWFPCTTNGGFDKVSKKAQAKGETESDMILIEMTVYVGSQEKQLSDWLLAGMLRKLIRYCKATGLMDIYETGRLKGEDCDGKNCWVRLERDNAEGKYKGRSRPVDYSPRNPEDPDAVAPAPSQARVEKESAKAAMLDGDEIPF